MRKSKAAIEREARETAAREARIRAALHWTDDTDIKPDVPPPERGGDGLTTGWTFNAYSKRVEVACSSSVFHGIGRIDKTNSQGTLALYSTQARAFRALRCALERQFATELEMIDRKIAQAL